MYEQRRTNIVASEIARGIMRDIMKNYVRLQRNKGVQVTPEQLKDIYDVSDYECNMVFADEPSL